MPSASAELNGFSVEIAVRNVIKDRPNPETLLSPGPTADAKGTEAHSKAVSSLPKNAPPAHSYW